MGGGFAGSPVSSKFGPDTASRRGAGAYARDRISTAMPAIRNGPLSKVKPISNEDEDELVQIFKDMIQHEAELEDAKVQLI